MAFDKAPKRGTTIARLSTFMGGGPHGLNTFTAILAILSTIIGGGIVGIPYSFLNFGIPLAIVLNILVVILTYYSGVLYLKAKDLVPDQPESLYEIGYMTLGRSSIFMVGTIQLVNSFGLMMIYFIVFSDTTGQLVGSFNGYALGEIWYSSRYFYVLILGAVLTPVILKKELAELEWLSIVLFASIGIFIVVNFWELVIDPKFVPET